MFEQVDTNGDNHVSRSELDKIVKEIHFGKTVDVEEAAAKLLQDLDLNRDDEISENEFVEGLSKWINSNSSKTANSKSSAHGTHQVFPFFLKKLTIFIFSSS